MCPTVPAPAWIYPLLLDLFPRARTLSLSHPSLSCRDSPFNKVYYPPLFLKTSPFVYNSHICVHFFFFFFTKVSCLISIKRTSESLLFKALQISHGVLRVRRFSSAPPPPHLHISPGYLHWKWPFFFTHFICARTGMLNRHQGKSKCLSSWSFHHWHIDIWCLMRQM